MGLRTVALVIISAGLMILSHQGLYLPKIRSQLSVLTLPVQYVVDQPIKFFYWLENSFSSQQEILSENATLRARQLLIQAKLQRQLALERENVQLRELLSSTSNHSAERMLVAQLISADLDPLNQEVILDKGERDGVFVGQPVLDAYGVMGQVVDVTPYSSRVLLITDGRSAIPGQNTRNGIRAIIAGTGYANELALLHIPGTADLAVGDIFFTSGLGGRFPSGYPIGQIVSINKTSGERFAVITLKPIAHIDQDKLVVLVWPQLPALDHFNKETSGEKSATTATSSAQKHGKSN